ncbi:hypothetical protein SNOG_02163 [Parastagonospora nodorum SN15]|uniref:Uncharacterized protein n=1 Tax=Phaeosphaeria nodorum (strain SN15 / ATCC MYA-4574 / FGSC 10173) TaxID=321614 RepID=Q0V1F1_PHANO|nr:hypothetical protein SNOG_02163 [Parastagonospora nodorum SN15]EAT90375.1 hypothetical protein SNOG_02163 [Parastagonospora nodorum SN15]
MSEAPMRRGNEPNILPFFRQPNPSPAPVPEFSALYTRPPDLPIWTAIVSRQNAFLPIGAGLEFASFVIPA